MILIVDGDIVAGACLERLLKYRGYEVLAVHSGSEALTLMDLRKPDVIILELRVDGIDGATLLRAIRKDAMFDAVPVIIYTTDFADELRREMLEAGAQDYIVKGTIGWKSLVKRIERFYRRPRK